MYVSVGWRSVDLPALFDWFVDYLIFSPRVKAGGQYGKMNFEDWRNLVQLSRCQGDALARFCAGAVATWLGSFPDGDSAAVFNFELGLGALGFALVWGSLVLTKSFSHEPASTPV